MIADKGNGREEDERSRSKRMMLNEKPLMSNY